MTSKTSEILLVHTFYSLQYVYVYNVLRTTYIINKYINQFNQPLFHYMIYMYVHVHNNSIPAGIIYIIYMHTHTRR